MLYESAKQDAATQTAAATHRSLWESLADVGLAGPRGLPGWCRPSAIRGRRAGSSPTAAGALGGKEATARSAREEIPEMEPTGTVLP